MAKLSYKALIVAASKLLAKKVREFPDRSVKLSLDEPYHIQEIIERALPEQAHLLDFAKMRLLESEKYSASWYKTVTDKFCEIPLKPPSKVKGYKPAQPQAADADSPTPPPKKRRRMPITVVAVENQMTPEDDAVFLGLHILMLFWFRQYLVWLKYQRRNSCFDSRLGSSSLSTWAKNPGAPSNRSKNSSIPRIRSRASLPSGNL